MDLVRPIKITSPISGQPVTPRIVTLDNGKQIIKEAHWIDPASGAFIRKGIISVEDKPQSN
jgi:hypothetical protein